MSELASKDLNLLLLFKTIWEERNLSRTAERLSLSQPAVSHALSRLREQMNDPLFVRSSKGVVPTQFAENIASDIIQAVRQLEQIYQKHQDFDPAMCEETLVFCFGDYFSATLLSQFVAKIQKEAPKVKITCRPDSENFSFEDFEKGHIHLAVTGFEFQMKEGFYSKKILEDSISCCHRKNHPHLKDKISLEDYLNAEHLFVSTSGRSSGIVDRSLKAMKKQRNVSMVNHSFFDAGLVLSKSDYILTAPTGLCQHLAKTHRLTISPPPFPLKPFPVRMYWHERLHTDPFHRWIRSCILKLIP